MDWTAIITAIGGIVIAVAGIVTKAMFDGKLIALTAKDEEQGRDIAELKAERDSLRATLEHQAQTLAEQAGRLTVTINALTQVTLERDVLKQQVRALEAERDALTLTDGKPVSVVPARSWDPKAEERPTEIRVVEFDPWAGA